MRALKTEAYRKPVGHVGDEVDELDDSVATAPHFDVASGSAVPCSAEARRRSGVRTYGAEVGAVEAKVGQIQHVSAYARALADAGGLVT